MTRLALAIQHTVMAQAAARAYPDRYRLLGSTINDPGASVSADPADHPPLPPCPIHDTQEPTP